MNSVIIWLLMITEPGAYCMSRTEITFKTEQECVTALSGLDKQHKGIAECVPRKSKESK